MSTVEVPAMGDNMRALLALSLTSLGATAIDPAPALELTSIDPGSIHLLSSGEPNCASP